MNSVVLIGRLTKDIELKYTASELAVARFTLAIDEGYGNKKKTNFVPCLAFGKTAENMEKFVGKGQKLAVQGRISTGSYEKDGQKRYTFDVAADRVEFIEFKGKTAENANESVPEGFAAIDEPIPF